MREELFQREQQGEEVEELQPPTSVLSTIEEMVARFNISQSIQESRLEEVEVEISDSEGEYEGRNKAQNHNNSDDDDDGEFF